MNRRSFLATSAAFASCALAAPAIAQSSALSAAAYSAERRGVSLVIMQRGRLVFEDYPNDGGAERGWELASGTKSFCGVMAAGAVQDRLLTLDEPAAETLREWRGDERGRITIRHLLSLTSGLHGDGPGRPPTYANAVALRPTAAPGDRFAYDPAPFQIFGEIVRRKINGDPLAYLQRRIFDPLAIRPTQWRRGSDGNPLMPQGAQFSARDWARFGEFVLRGGDGLVDAPTLAANFEPSRANPGYGLTWWLLRDGLIPPARRGGGVEIDAAFAERYGGVSMAAGAGDQRLYLVPELGLVIARQASGILRAMLGRDRSPRWSDAEFLRLVLGN